MRERKRRIVFILVSNISVWLAAHTKKDLYAPLHYAHLNTVRQILLLPQLEREL